MTISPKWVDEMFSHNRIMLLEKRGEGHTHKAGIAPLRCGGY